MPTATPMSTNHRQPARVLGLLLILLGVVTNKWSLGWLFSRDALIQSQTTLLLIQVGQGALIVLGLLFILGLRPTRLPRRIALVLSIALLPLIGYLAYNGLRGSGRLETAEEAKQSTEIRRMLASESVHLNLGPRLKKLSKSIANLKIPSGEALDVLAAQVTIRDLDAHQELTPYKELPEAETTIFKWHVEEGERTVAKAEVDLLRPFFDRVELVETGKFYFVGGNFVGDDFSKWEVRGAISALAKLKDGSYAKVKGNVVIGWQLDPAALSEEARRDFEQNKFDPDKVDLKNYDAWFIDKLAFQDFKTLESPQIFFSEELDKAVQDPTELAEARRSRAQEMIVEMLKTNAAAKEAREKGLPAEDWKAPHEFWGHMAAWRHDTVAVTDANQDGFDDFYTMPRYGTNQLFVNNQDGTFKDMAEEVGLDVTDHSGAAIFADFDNDGDDDVFIGRTIGRSKYMKNESGHYAEASKELLSEEPPYFVVTASAVDYDRDGLLDLYAGTYAAQLLDKDFNRDMHEKGEPWVKEHRVVLEEYLPEADAKALFEHFRHGMQHKIRDRVGPPNLLFKNGGDGKLQVVRDTPLFLFRNTFQATWADFDADGDQDVYVANDFAPGNLFQNDAGRFTDITERTAAEDIGFGMGASWGDFDQDGDQDLYKSNMYSKAGNRILPMISAVDPTFKRMAGGNSLMEWNGGKFERVSSVDGENGTMAVEMGGWSWGSMFVDVNNDTWLDIYSLSGHYSAPKEIEAGHDL